MKGHRRVLQAFAVILGTTLAVSLMACSSDSDKERLTPGVLYAHLL